MSGDGCVKKNVVSKRVGRRQSINEGPAKPVLLSLHLCPSVLATNGLVQDHGEEGRSMSLRNGICTMFSQSLTEVLNHYVSTWFLSCSKF